MPQVFRGKKTKFMALSISNSPVKFEIETPQHGQIDPDQKFSLQRVARKTKNDGNRGSPEVLDEFKVKAAEHSFRGRSC